MLSKCFFMFLDSYTSVLLQLLHCRVVFQVSHLLYGVSSSFKVRVKKNNDWSKPVSKNLSFHCCLNLSPMCQSIIFSENISIDVKSTKYFLLLQQQKTQHFPAWWQMIWNKATQGEAKIVNITLIRCTVSGQASCQITHLGEML